MNSEIWKAGKKTRVWLMEDFNCKIAAVKIGSFNETLVDDRVLVQ